MVARHTVDVVVVNKVKGIDVLIDAAVRKLTVERMGDLKVVVVVVARINALVALIVGDGIEHFAADNAVVVAADHLAVEPKFGIFALAGLAELFEELTVHHIRRVQTQTVNAEFVDPEADRIEQILHDLGVLQIQLDQIIVSCPALIPKRVAVGTAAVKVQVLEPAAVGGVPLLLLHILKCEEFSADVVEHAVQNDTDAVFAQHGADLFERSVVAETAVDAAVVDGVVAVAAALKHRIK